MSRINVANYYLVQSAFPGQTLCARLAQDVVPSDGTMYLFSTEPDGERLGAELCDGFVRPIKYSPFDVAKTYVLVGLVGRGQASVIVQTAGMLVGRDVAEYEVGYLDRAAVEGMKKSAELAIDLVVRRRVIALLDELISSSTAVPKLVGKFQALGDEGFTELRALQNDETYGAAAGVVLRVLGK